MGDTGNHRRESGNDFQYGGVVRDPNAEYRMESVGRRLTHAPSRRLTILELGSGCQYRLLDSKGLDVVPLPRLRKANP